MKHNEYMRLAIELAKKGENKTAPNPMVGAILVKDERIIGQGYHEYFGGPHAEVNAIADAKSRGENVEGATLYVTLEPCSHYGKTPPCANLIIDSKIKEVYTGLSDPNPKVNGQGISILKNAGVIVHSHILEKECFALNEGFINLMTKGRPLVTVKTAMSLDGKIATKNGQSQWITNEDARIFGHNLRAEHNCILVGIGTILADNPQLNCRTKDVQPDCIVLDSMGKLPNKANIFLEKNRKVLVFISKECPTYRKKELEAVGAHLYEVSSCEGKLSIIEVITILKKIGYASILIEGGSSVIASFIEKKMVDKIWTFIGNTIIGGIHSIPSIGDIGVELLSDAPKLEFQSVQLIKNNVYILSKVKETLCLQEL